MKKLLLLASASLVFATTYASASWINPSRTICTANGGRLAPDGVCEANWRNATRICSATNARLPKRSELRKVVTDCGGVFNDEDNNQNDAHYQSCYSDAGFYSSNYYWSSMTDTSLNNYAWIVYFKYGYDSNYNKGGINYVVCIK
jgi:hypothetical protein